MDGFRLARDIADEGIRGTLLLPMERWDRVKKRFPDSPARPDTVTLCHAARTLLQPPCPEHAREAARLLGVQVRAEVEESGRRRPEILVRDLAREKGMPDDRRRTLEDLLPESR